jgi:hypothetical protein
MSKEVDSDEEYVVEQILAKREKVDSVGLLHVEYLIQWEAFRECTWEPKQNINHHELISQFEEKGKEEKKNREEGQREEGNRKDKEYSASIHPSVKKEIEVIDLTLDPKDEKPDFSDAQPISDPVSDNVLMRIIATQESIQATVTTIKSTQESNIATNNVFWALQQQVYARRNEVATLLETENRHLKTVNETQLVKIKEVEVELERIKNANLDQIKQFKVTQQQLEDIMVDLKKQESAPVLPEVNLVNFAIRQKIIV